MTTTLLRYGVRNFSRMKKKNIVITVICAVSLPFAGGCTSTSKTKLLSSHTTMNSGAYVSEDTQISNDIREILSQGGVDVVSGKTPVASVTAKTAKVISETATNLETLVAQLSDRGISPVVLPLAQPIIPKTALALVSSPKEIKTKKTTIFESIGVGVELPTPSLRLQTPAVSAPAPVVVTPVIEKKVAVKKSSGKRDRLVVKPKSSYKPASVARF